MGLRGFGGSFLVAFFILSFICSGVFAEKTIEEHWKDVGLTEDVIFKDLTTENCYLDPVSFSACVFVANAVLAAHPENRTLVPKFRLTEEGFGAPVREYGEMVVAARKPVVVQTRLEAIQYSRTERKRFTESLRTAFQSQSKTDFTEFFKWLFSEPHFRDNRSVLSARALNAFLSVMRDPHTVVIPRAYAEQESKVEPDSFVGVGVKVQGTQINGQPALLVTEPIEGGPALEAGIRAKDVVVAIDGVALKDIPENDRMGRLRGEEGTTVQVEVLRKGQRITIPIVRKKIITENVIAKKLGESGYIRLGDFMRPNSCSQMKEKILSLQESGARQIILDLRSNPGGRVDQAVCIAGIFLPNKSLVMTQKFLFETPAVELRTQEEPLTDLPMVTLINAGSASASELLSGALQDHKRSLIVGVRSFGKGTVQTQRILNHKLVMRDTIARFYQPSGRTNQIQGISPDIEVYSNPEPTDEDKIAYREEDEYNAIPTNIQPWKQPRPDYILKISGCLSSQGAAKSLFQKNQDAAIPPDYQLLYAEDVARCHAKIPSQLFWGELPFPKVSGFEIPSPVFRRIVKDLQMLP